MDMQREDDEDGAPAGRLGTPSRPPQRLHPGQLDVFHAVVTTGSVTAASRVLNLSQPAVSRRLADLERAVGFALFLRDGKRLTITPEGVAFHDEVSVSFVGLERMAKVAGEIRELRRGHLRFATIPALSLGPVPLAVAAFMKRHPAVKVTFEVHAASRIRDALADGLFDLAVTQLPDAYPGVVIRHTFHAPCLCVLPPGHALTHRDVVTLQDLSRHPLISLSPDGQAAGELFRRLAAAGLAVSPRAETLTSLAACSLVAADVGICLVDPFTAESFGGGQVVVRPFAPSLDFCFRIALPARRIAARATATLVDLLVDHIIADPRIRR